MRLRILFLLLLCSQSDLLSADPVTGFSAFYKHGQVFCTWINLQYTGVEYCLYKSASPILSGSQLVNCQYLGVVRDSSSLNEELGEILGQSIFLKPDSALNPLPANRGLFVTTSQQNGNFYYALTTRFDGIEDTSVNAGLNSLGNPVAEIVDRPAPVFQFNTPVSNHIVSVYVLFTSLASTALFPQMANVGSLPFNIGVYRSTSTAPHPLTIKLPGGGSNFLTDIVASLTPDEYRIGLDNWLPNENNSLWYGYNEHYDIYNKFNSPPVSGTNYDYVLEALEYTIDWGIHNLGVDTNSVYFSAVSGGASGAFFSSLTFPSKIAAASLKVPKFDLSFLHDPDTTNNYNEGMPGRLKVDTLIGTVPTNLLTNFGVHTYDLLNGGWLAHQHANDNVPLIFAVNGKRDTMVGWAEKIPYYDSVNNNRLGGFYFWDNRKHSGDGAQWTFPVNLLRYHRNVSFPAFSNCSFNNDPGDGHATSGDSLGTINGFLDWNDSITDDADHYQIKLFMHDLLTYYTTVIAPDSCNTDITLRRLQNFEVPEGALILWESDHSGQVVQQDSFLYPGGLITLHAVKIFQDTSVIKVSFTIPLGIVPLPAPPLFDVFVYPNPNKGEFSIRISRPRLHSVRIELSDLSGRILLAENSDLNKEQETIFSIQNKTAGGLYVLRVYAGTQLSNPVLIAVQ